MHWIKRLEFNLLLARIRFGTYSRNYISLVDFGLTDADLRLLIATLDKSPRIKAQIELIDLSNSKIDGASVNTLTAVVLKGFPKLKTLILAKNKIHILALEDTDAIEVLRVGINRLEAIIGLKELYLLTELDIYGNRFVSINLHNNNALQTFIASRNGFRLLNLAHKPNLQTAILDNNPLRSVFIIDSPLSKKFTFSERDLDDTSKLAIARHKNSLADQSSLQDLDYYGRIMDFTPNSALSTAKLVAYFNQVFSQQAAVLNRMLGDARVAYYDMLKLNSALEIALVQDIVFNGFAANVNSYIQQFFQGLITTPENAAEVQGFIQNEFKQLLKTRLDKAKGLFFNAALDNALKKHHPTQAKKLSACKAMLEANTAPESKITHQPGLFLSAFNYVRSTVSSYIYSPTTNHNKSPAPR